MSPEETFRRVLAARLPAGPAWAAWIDGTVSELAAASSGVTLTPEEAIRARDWYTRLPIGVTPDDVALATRLKEAF